MKSIRDFLDETSKVLSNNGILDPHLESEIMITDSLNIPRHRMYVLQDQSLDVEIYERLQRTVHRRLNREPLAYILGHKEFYGIDLIVGPGVMVPRPETELLVEQAMIMCLDRLDRGSLTIADVGTGSGCIAVNLAIHLPMATIFATELSPEAFRISETNVKRYKVGERVELLLGDLLLPINGKIDVIVANLPYVKEAAFNDLQLELLWEPRQALDGGHDGLITIKELLSQATGKLLPGGAILLECDPDQMEPLSVICSKLFPGSKVSVYQDFTGLDRIFVLET